MSDGWAWLYTRTAAAMFLWTVLTWICVSRVPGGPVVGFIFYGVPFMILVWAETVLITTPPRDLVHILFYPIFALLVLMASILVCVIIDTLIYGLDGIQ